jgi:Ger(x)C family germination protein
LEKPENSNYFNVKESGASTLSILQETTLTLSRRLYFSHNQLIIFGEDLAKAGVRDSFDFFVRHSEPRLTAYVLVAKGKAEDILDTQPSFEKIPASEISELMEDSSGSIEKPTVFAYEFALGLLSKTTAAIAPIVEVREERGKKHFYLSGLAAFKDDRLAGELDEKECRGYQWVTGKVKHGGMSIPIDGEFADIVIISSKSKVTPMVLDDGTVKMKVEITGEGFLGSQAGSNNFNVPENAGNLQKMTEQTIKKEIEDTLNKTRAMGADIFGFGEIAYRKYPRQWKALEPQWDEIYKNIEVETDVKIKITGTGSLQKNLYPEER